MIKKTLVSVQTELDSINDDIYPDMCSTAVVRLKQPPQSIGGSGNFVDRTFFGSSMIYWETVQSDDTISSNEWDFFTNQ